MILNVIVNSLQAQDKGGAAGHNVPAAHPDLVAVRGMLSDAALAPPSSSDVHAVRSYLARLNAFAGKASAPLAREQLLTFAIGGREVECKLYWPDATERAALMFYCHGGGFRHGELAGWDAPLRQLVRDSGVAVLSIGYALSPEYRFPTALDEIITIMRRVINQGQIDSRPVHGFAAGGDSAGANLALAAAVALRDAGLPVLRHLMLLYGVYSKDVSRPSWGRLSGFGGHGLSIASMSTYWASYADEKDDDWRVQPLHADLAGLPQARVIIGDLDPLLDENIALAEKMTAAGVPVELAVLPGITHGVVRFNELAPVVRELLRDEAIALRSAFE